MKLGNPTARRSDTGRDKSIEGSGPCSSSKYSGPALSCGVLILLVLAIHIPFLRLAYFWDEAGHFIPAARDILQSGRWIPTSTPPNIHPPGLMAYLAIAWRVAGFTPVVTRLAMLLLGGLSLAAALLLAEELCRDHVPSYLTALLLLVSPLFFAQSMLAQLDAPAMLFTTLALLFYLRGRIATSAALCVILTVVKETGVIVPIVFAADLIWQRRGREARWFGLPALILAVWVGVLDYRTGHWAGSAEFARYNLQYLLDPFRMTVSLLRRCYYLAFANFHWIGAAAIVCAWKKIGGFRSPRWRVASLLAAVHVAAVVILGGANLERYLLPIMPIVYAAMAMAIAAIEPALLRTAVSAALVTGVAAGNWMNPPYPFPYENNLALADFTGLQMKAAQYLARRYPAARIDTAWPLTLELTDPTLGYISRPLFVSSITDLTPASLKRVDWKHVQVLVIFSKTWQSRPNLMQFAPVRSLWENHYEKLPATRQQAAAIIPFPRTRHFEQRGQWVDIYVTSNAPAASQIANPAQESRDDGFQEHEPAGGRASRVTSSRSSAIRMRTAR